ncbi:MAG: hypothetical protein KatS3mg129_2448 [Leptospiraceae bacterium]|nr:MAG: hypothetical protein KatS3mg129_2448 [Leptospiraceae bacterium]
MELSSLLSQFKSLIFLLSILWGIFAILHIFHFGFNILWRFIIIIIYILFLFFYFPYFLEEYNLLYSNYIEFLKKLLNNILLLINYFDFILLILWPVILIHSFFSAKEKQSLDRIKILIVITLIYWIYLLIINDEYFQNILKNYFIKIF